MGSPRSFWPVILLLVPVLIAEFLLFTHGRQSTEDLWQTFNEGTEQERIEALFILANRDVPQGIDKSLVARMLQSPYPRVREMSMLSSIVRHTGHRKQQRYVTKQAGPEEALRCRLLLVHQKVGEYVKRDEMRRYLELIGED